MNHYRGSWCYSIDLTDNDGFVGLFTNEALYVVVQALQWPAPKVYSNTSCMQKEAVDRHGTLTGFVLINIWILL